MNPIPMLNLLREYEYLRKDIDVAISQCLQHQQWILGQEVGQFEKEVAAYLGVRDCVGVASGTDALLLSLRALALHIKEKEQFDKTDKVIVTPFTFIATGEAIVRSGASLVFIDINPATFNIDTEKIKQYLQEHHSEIVGIIPVHLFGQACNMDEIKDIAQEYNLFVLEDVAQAFGGTYKGKRLGSFGNAAAFSFFPSKNLGGFGDGGLVATNNDQVAAQVRLLLRHGGKDMSSVEHIGYNSRLDTFQAAVLLAKIKQVEEFNQKRRSNAKLYHEILSQNKDIIIPACLLEQCQCVYHQYTIRILNNKRDSIQKQLKNAGIATSVYYRVPLHKMKVFEGRCVLPTIPKEAEKAAEEVLSLPMGPFLTEEEILYICKQLKKHTQ